MLEFLVIAGIFSLWVLIIPIAFLAWCGQTKGGLEFKKGHYNFVEGFEWVYKKLVGYLLGFYAGLWIMIYLCGDRGRFFGYLFCLISKRYEVCGY